MRVVPSRAVIAALAHLRPFTSISRLRSGPYTTKSNDFNARVVDFVNVGFDQDGIVDRRTNRDSGLCCQATRQPHHFGAVGLHGEVG